MKRSEVNSVLDGFTLVERMLSISLAMLFVAMALGVSTKDFALGNSWLSACGSVGCSNAV